MLESCQPKLYLINGLESYYSELNILYKTSKFAPDYLLIRLATLSRAINLSKFRLASI